MEETIKIIEGKLREIISENIKTFLKTNHFFPNDIDITKIPIEELRLGYKDFRLVPKTSMFGKTLYQPSTIKEVVGDILPPDNVVNSIIKKYNLPHSLVVKKEHFHNIFVYAIVAKIGINDKLIEDDMKEMGYFLSIRHGVQKVDNMLFEVLQFEPYSQLQEDITDNLKKSFKILYHWTPTYNIESIKNNGLVPSHKNSYFNYPPRTYLMSGDSSSKQMYDLGQQLCIANNNPQNNGKYALLSVNIQNLNNDIRFYYDPNSEIGIFTEQIIPKENIKIGKTINFICNLK